MNLQERPAIYAHPAAFEPKYARGLNGTSREIGMPLKVKEITRSKAEIRWVRMPAEISKGLFLTGPIPRVTDFEDSGGPFFADARCMNPDELPDDQAVFMDTPLGIVVLLGCAHAGVINTLQYIRDLTGGSRIRAVMGGMHLLAASQERMDKTVSALKDLAVQELFPAHCTGRTRWNASTASFPRGASRSLPARSLELEG
jgi:7,8-dihydropterin-6-yl-methyl-4-(beta-D-ribofuranosyl)aminobenzene 5'-phosphate synthase